MWHNEHANRPHRMRCDECFRALPINPPGQCLGTGCGVTAAGAARCYACCAKHDTADMIATGRAVLYLSGSEREGWRVTNWPESLVFPASARRMRHPFAREAWLASFTGPDGAPWTAKNIGDSQIAHCRRVKA